MAKLRLPLVCSIISEKFNCSAIKFQSSRVKEIHLTEHRMKVLEQHFEEEKVAINSTVFIRSNIEIEENRATPYPTFLETMKWPIIGSLGAILFLIILGLGYISQLSKANKEGVKVEINNAANANNESPSCSMDVANQMNLVPQPAQFHEEENQIFVGPLQIQEGAQVNDAPPDYYSTVDINNILAIPPAKRNAFETRAAIRHLSMRKPSAPQPDQE